MQVLAVANGDACEQVQAQVQAQAYLSSASSHHL